MLITVSLNYDDQLEKRSHKYAGFHVKCQLSWSDVNQTHICLTDFSESSKD